MTHIAEHLKNFLSVLDALSKTKLRHHIIDPFIPVRYPIAIGYDLQKTSKLPTCFLTDI